MRALAMSLILLSAVPLSPAARREWFIVWNVGQGLWTTRVSWDECDQFDTGGERFPLENLRRICPRGPQRLHFSHGDWDHVGGLPRLRRTAAGLCLAAKPGGKMKEKKFHRLFEGLAECHPAKSTREIRWRQRGKDSNSASRVFLREGVLLPGDSPSGEEKIWARGLPADIRVLVLGHHGSRTSTSDLLLGRLPNLRLAIASARAARYGHPHPTVVARLKRWRVPLLRTEEWGNLILEL